MTDEQRTLPRLPELRRRRASELSAALNRVADKYVGTEERQTLAEAEAFLDECAEGADQDAFLGELKSEMDTMAFSAMWAGITLAPRVYIKRRDGHHVLVSRYPVADAAATPSPMGSDYG